MVGYFCVIGPSCQINGLKTEVKRRESTRMFTLFCEPILDDSYLKFDIYTCQLNMFCMNFLQSSGSSLSVQLLHCVFNCLTSAQEDGKLIASDLTPLSVELGGRLLNLAFQLGIEVSF